MTRPSSLATARLPSIVVHIGNRRVACVEMVQEVPGMGGGQVLVPTVVEATDRGERSFDIYSRLLARARRVPRHRARRRRRQPDRGAAAVPGGGGSGEGHRALHQLSGRLGHRDVRDLRHDAGDPSRRRHVVHGAGGVGGSDAARVGHAGQAVRAPERARADPPAARRRRGTVDRHRDPSEGDRPAAPSSGGDPRRSTPARRSRRCARTRTATSSCPPTTRRRTA